MSATEAEDYVEISVSDTGMGLSEKDIRLIGSVSKGIHAFADQDMLMAIMINLLSNAISYNKDGGWAGLEVNESGNDVIIKVSDGGIGIAEEDIGRIWDRFYQADPSRSGGGAGLGLSIVRILTECQGGSVSVESVRGEGSTFTVRIPKSSDALIFP